MALTTSADGLITAATTIESFEGKIELDFTEAGGQPETYILDSNKAPKRSFVLHGGVNRFVGFRVLGSGHAITQPAATGDPADPTYRVYSKYGDETPRADDIVTGGFGKVDFEPSMDNDDQLRNIKNVSSIVGLAFGAGAYTLDPAAIVIAQSGGSAVTVVSEGTALSNNTIAGGTGTALITEGSNTKTLRLDEASFPFAVATADGFSVEPLGSSLIFTS